MTEEGTMEDYTVVNTDPIDLNLNIRVSLIRFDTRKNKQKNTKTFSFWHFQDELNVSALVGESWPPAWFIWGVTTWKGRWRTTDQRWPIFFPGRSENWNLIGGRRAESRHTFKFLQSTLPSAFCAPTQIKHKWIISDPTYLRNTFTSQQNK